RAQHVGRVHPIEATRRKTVQHGRGLGVLAHRGLVDDEDVVPEERATCASREPVVDERHAANMPCWAAMTQPRSYAIAGPVGDLVVHEWRGDGAPTLLAHPTGFHGRLWAPVAERL